jgi:hypothetical protein
MVGKSDLLLVLGAMMVFSLLTVNVNSFLLKNNIIQVNSELNFNAVSLAQNIIDVARTKSFDETTTNGNQPAVIPSGFSTTLGPESGETYQNFNDFDDYNNYTKKDTTESGVYTALISVNYVTGTNYTQISSIPTIYKRMIVKITSKNLKDTVRVSFIKSYY